MSDMTSGYLSSDWSMLYLASIFDAACLAPKKPQTLYPQSLAQLRQTSLQLSMALGAAVIPTLLIDAILIMRLWA